MKSTQKHPFTCLTFFVVTIIVLTVGIYLYSYVNHSGTAWVDEEDTRSYDDSVSRPAPPSPPPRPSSPEEWSAEERVRHPQEYTELMLREVEKMLADLDVEITQLLKENRRLQEIRQRDEQSLASTGARLEELKNAYQLAEASAAWPTDYHGARWTREAMRKEIMATHGDHEDLLRKAAEMTNRLTLIEAGINAKRQQQLDLVRTQEDMRQFLRDLQTKKLLASTPEVAARLRDLNASLAALGLGKVLDPSEFDLSVESESFTDEEFDAVMGN